MNFFLNDTSAHCTSNNLAAGLHSSKVMNIAEEEKNPIYHKKKIPIYSFPWTGVHDKAPGENNKQLISEVTVTSCVPIVKMFQKMQKNLSPHIWIPSRNTVLLYKAAKSFECMHTSNRHRTQRNTFSWKYWNVTCFTHPSRKVCFLWKVTVLH